MSFRKSGILAFVVAVRAFAADAPACPSEPADEAQVVEAMRTFYAALTTDDLPKFQSVIAPGFYAYDGGKRFEGDALSNQIKAGHAAGRTYVWTVTEPQVHVDCKVAWISYVNKGSVGVNAVVWLESAFMQKVDGRWRIAFFHSTRVP